VWWKRGRVGWRDVTLLLPFLVAGVAMGLVTLWFHRVEELHFHVPAKWWDYSLVERGLIAGRAVWFYLGKLVWPHPLVFIYPLWKPDASRLVAYLPLLIAVAGLFVLWRNRESWGRPALVAFGYFLALLFPVLGIFGGYFFRYAFVAD